MLALSLLTAVVFTSCTGGKKAKVVLDAAAGMLAEHPDSAYLLLTGSDSLFAGESEALRMLHTLMMADAANKAFIPLTADSLLRAATVYYDAHGDANERVRAHYLLGCAYRDMGNAVGALREYYEAVDRADTLSRDCDYKLMSCVLGQMSDVFSHQFMPVKAIWACSQYSKYALMAGDTLNWILGMERSIPEFLSAGDTAKVLAMTDSVSLLYKRHGYAKKSADVFPTAITVYIEQCKYKKAGELMRMFEKGSGAFDDEGNIEVQREQYYYDVGMYNLGVGNWDIAERAFRRLPQYGYSYESSKGLLELYRQKDNKDSILKYSRLLEQALDEEQDKLETEKIERVISAHDYSHYQKTTSQMTVRAKRLETLLWLVCIIVGVFIIAVYFRKRIRRHVLKNADAPDDSAALTVSPEHIETVDVKPDGIQAVLTSDILIKFRGMCGGSKNIRLSSKDWSLLFEEVRLRMPSFYGSLFNKKELSDIERKICVLVCLNFSSADIIIILDSTPQSIANYKRRVNEKLFGDNTARTLSHNLHGLSV